MPLASEPLNFRPFAADDAGLLGAWLAAAGLGVPPGVATRAWATRVIQDPNISCWAAARRRGVGGAAEQIVGFFRLDTGPDQKAEVTILVAPRKRRQGLGRRLLEEALNQARARGIRKVLAVIDANNGPALDFFHDAGFSHNGSNTPGHIHLHRLIHRAERPPPLEIQP